MLFWLGVVVVSAKSLDILNGRTTMNVPKMRRSLRIIAMVVLGIVLVFRFWNLMEEAKVVAVV